LLEEIPPEARSAQLERAYLLKAALWLSGDRRYERDLKSPDLSPIRNERRNGPRFYSDLRFRGLQLSVVTDLFGREEAPALEAMVASGLAGKRSRWYTTQEIAWALTGLGKRLDQAPATFEPPVLKAGRRVLAATPGTDDAKDPSRSWTLGRASEYSRLTLTIPSKGEGSLFVLVSSDGVREDADLSAFDEGVAVTRRWMDSSGGALRSDASPDLGDLLHVVVQVRNLRSHPISNLAVVDRLPAGFEIENPRLGRQGSEQSGGRPWAVDSMNLRDDRVELFGTLPAGEVRTFTYAVRAVTAGEFAVPPIEAEAMYDPTVRSREPGTRLRIQGPWGPASTDEEPPSAP
jgi:hypothetical protein